MSLVCKPVKGGQPVGGTKGASERWLCSNMGKRNGNYLVSVKLLNTDKHVGSVDSGAGTSE